MLSKIRNSSNYINTPSSRLCSKFQDYTATANTYAYSPNAKPHAVRRYYNGLAHELSNLRWDNNGNLAQQTIYSVNNNTTNYQTMRMLFWDEDDRLNLVAGDGYLSYYAYGHDGNRAIKMTGTATIDPNGTLINTGDLNNITIYPNEYLSVTQAEYTKYYYANGNRIASKIGTGGFEKMQMLCTLDPSPTYNANTLLNVVLQQVTNTLTDEYPVDVCNGYNVSNELLHSQLLDFYISNTVLNFTQSNLLQQFRQNLAGGTEAVYYFHSDHLGSASWITDGSGLPVQHLLYLPFGEHFANEHSSGYDERFTFTGKERDAETGYYYHGARFNSSDIGWISVDPQFDNLPSITPYNYCLWNPVILHDHDGEFPLWAMVGAAIDYGLQVYNNYNQGKTGVEAWTDINVVSVVGSAINPFSKVKAATTVAKVAKVAGEVACETAQNAVDIRVDKNGLNVTTQDVKDVAINTAVGYAAGKAGGKLYNSGSADAVKKANKGAQSAQNKLNRAQTKNANAPSAKTAQRVANAKSAQHTARAKQVRTNMAHATVGRSEGATTTAVKTAAKVVTHEPKND